MRWLVIGIGGLVGLVAVVVVVGMLLPRDHVASSTVQLAQPSDSVWAVVRNFAGYPDWWPNVRSMERITDHEREAWRQVDRTNSPMPMEVTVDEPPTRLVTSILDEGLPFGGTWTYELSPVAGGTRVTITEDGKVYNPIFRFVSRFIMGHHGTMDDYLTAIGKRFDETVSPEHVELGAR